MRVKEYDKGTPYILLEQQAFPGQGAADAMRPFVFDLKPGIPVAEVEAQFPGLACTLPPNSFAAPVMRFSSMSFLLNYGAGQRRADRPG